MRKGAAITARFRRDPNRLGALDPALRRKDKVVAASLIFKPLEFERFKTRVAQFLPKSEKLDGAAAAHPIVDDRKRLLRVSIPGDVRQRDEVLVVLRDDGDGRPLNFDAGAFGFAHGCGLLCGGDSNPVEFDGFNWGEFAIAKIALLLLIRAES